MRLVDVNGQPGMAAVAPDGTVITVLTLDVVDDRVQTVWAVVNPDKLARAATALVDS
jgi:RNA polymerase sigma-70 factor, ECF subfamily